MMDNQVNIYGNTLKVLLDQHQMSNKFIAQKLEISESYLSLMLNGERYFHAKYLNSILSEINLTREDFSLKINQENDLKALWEKNKVDFKKFKREYDTSLQASQIDSSNIVLSNEMSISINVTKSEESNLTVQLSLLNLTIGELVKQLEYLKNLNGFKYLNPLNISKKEIYFKININDYFFNGSILKLENSSKSKIELYKMLFVNKTKVVDSNLKFTSILESEFLTAQKLEKKEFAQIV